MLSDYESYQCHDCGACFKEREAALVEVPDDRDQMYGRPLSGTRTIYTCPECGSEEYDYAD